MIRSVSSLWTRNEWILSAETRHNFNTYISCLIACGAGVFFKLNLLAKAPCWNFPKRGGDGASEGYYFYSPQSSTVIKSKMAATTILRTRARFRPPKIRLYCKLAVWLHCLSLQLSRGMDETIEFIRFIGVVKYKQDLHCSSSKGQTFNATSPPASIFWVISMEVNNK